MRRATGEIHPPRAAFPSPLDLVSGDDRSRLPEAREISLHLAFAAKPPLKPKVQARDLTPSPQRNPPRIGDRVALVAKGTQEVRRVGERPAPLLRRGGVDHRKKTHDHRLSAARRADEEGGSAIGKGQVERPKRRKALGPEAEGAGLGRQRGKVRGEHHRGRCARCAGDVKAEAPLSPATRHATRDRMSSATFAMIDRLRALPRLHSHVSLLDLIRTEVPKPGQSDGDFLGELVVTALRLTAEAIDMEEARDEQNVLYSMQNNLDQIDHTARCWAREEENGRVLPGPIARFFFATAIAEKQDLIRLRCEEQKSIVRSAASDKIIRIRERHATRLKEVDAYRCAIAMDAALAKDAPSGAEGIHGRVGFPLSVDPGNEYAIHASHLRRLSLALDPSSNDPEAMASMDLSKLRAALYRMEWLSAGVIRRGAVALPTGKQVLANDEESFQALQSHLLDRFAAIMKGDAFAARERREREALVADALAYASSGAARCAETPRYREILRQQIGQALVHGLFSFEAERDLLRHVEHDLGLLAGLKATTAD